MAAVVLPWRPADAILPHPLDADGIPIPKTGPLRPCPPMVTTLALAALHPGSSR
ncbi:hypothetical protein I545_3714 [Mycobacterium kansasii 662]|uniref:Uncharacterized protein n=2 Tax=Mycobacterium kansasii TaxID=1768 RepID=A0A1V3X4M3_MYCKA|nr:hypothetical protein I547_5505 [Mycobacterium kansasii 824]EUA17135.1 hypothetical protein I545_3714 [Mycobacterium kansasii 662]KEP41681.1 hypothetical protein MKSMC1_31510 [Mycobacterium kansasii]OOK74095.1 hypothetical protein BZL30_5013 [Mycobacterium kansasii]OOK77727.1 hypothetical protein BZL29_3772 [Mycobacterium kansasii]